MSDYSRAVTSTVAIVCTTSGEYGTTEQYTYGQCDSCIHNSPTCSRCLLLATLLLKHSQYLLDFVLLSGLFLHQIVPMVSYSMPDPILQSYMVNTAVPSVICVTPLTIAYGHVSVSEVVPEVVQIARYPGLAGIYTR